MKQSDILRAKLDEKATAATKLCDKVDAGGTLTASEEAELKRLVADVEATGAELRAQTELENSIRVARAATINAPGYTPSDPNFGPIGGSNVRVITPTLNAFRGNGNKAQAMLDAYDCGLWLQAHVGGDGEARAKLEARRGQTWLGSQSEYQPQQGGYLVPAPLEAAVIVSRQEVGALRKLARIMPMTSETLEVPKQSDGTTVYYPGEEGSITASDLDFGRAGLVAKKRAIYSLFSNELRDDALASIADLLAADMGHQFALKEDSEFIDGDGTSTYGGVAGVKNRNTAATASIAQAATGHDTWPELDFSDFAAVMAKLPAKYRAGNNLAWLCSPSFKWAVMDRLALGANGALSQVWVDGQPKEMFLGYPVVLSDFCPTSTAAATVCCWFGNWQRAVLLGERGGVRIATSEHIAFQTDQTAVRGTVRYDINFHEPGDASNAGAVVSLKTAA